MKNNDHLRTWKKFKEDKLDYKTEIEKQVISEMAKLVVQIVERRRSLGLTQTQVAELAGITQAQVGRLETSSTIPSIETVVKVAIALGMTINLSSYEEQSAARMTYV
ncbi:helix-turn-helix transcriptional regulator [Paenibacillus sp. FSL H8-0104]|uniref:helix-turn-helix domain-containing protein n=1 Tax=Paenibacillus sp. FSL H8-0104 TaxID=2954509 RepID=UPI0030FD8DCB